MPTELLFYKQRRKVEICTPKPSEIIIKQKSCMAGRRQESRNVNIILFMGEVEEVRLWVL